MKESEKQLIKNKSYIMMFYQLVKEIKGKEIRNGF